MSTQLVRVAALLGLAAALSACPEQSTTRNATMAASDGGERAASPAGDPAPTEPSSDAALPSAMLTEAEVTALRYMREEEKLARDVYLLNADTLRVFDNIRASEEQHMSAMLTLLERYGVSDPVGDNAPGVFVNPDLQALYEALAERAQASLVDALRVGAEIEEIDIVDLQDAIADTTRDDIALVYGNLMRASRNHLRAFTSNLAMRGVVYEPLHLSAQAYAEIVDGAMERGGR